jgi:uncharacterized protein YggE
MNESQAIQNPFGLNVFGSAVIRVAPDVASITLSVATSAKKPTSAFEETRRASRTVREYFAKIKVDDVQASRITLVHNSYYDGGRLHFRDFTARIGFHIILRDIDRLEEVICGAVDAGANEVGSVTFQSTQLKEYREKARRQAVAAAKQKAAVYAEAAGVTLGRILHIEDVNPERLNGRESHASRQEPEVDDAGPLSSFDPGAIAIGGAIMLSYELHY